MPDSIADVKLLKCSLEKNKKLVLKAEEKICKAVRDMKNGKPPQEGLGIACRLAGLFVQRLYFFWIIRKYTDKLKINSSKCVGCGLCEKLCPMKNIKVLNGRYAPQGRCTMCYRCIKKCPKQAITLLGKEVAGRDLGK